MLCRRPLVRRILNLRNRRVANGAAAECQCLSNSHATPEFPRRKSASAPVSVSSACGIASTCTVAISLPRSHEAIPRTRIT